MPKTKEEKRVYLRIYRELNKEKIKEYSQTPVRKKTMRISSWKKKGIIVEDWDKFHELFLSITNCEKCKKELTYDKRNTHSTKCVDHDHLVNDKPNVRMICCHACNAEDKLNNTSGESNIRYRESHKCWYFEKIIQGKRYYKGLFKTKEEAINYKKVFLSQHIIEKDSSG